MTTDDIPAHEQARREAAARDDEIHRRVTGKPWPASKKPLLFVPVGMSKAERASHRRKEKNRADYKALIYQMYYIMAGKD